MNKKFSTLMAAFLLAANVGTFTADAVSFDTKLAYKAPSGANKAEGKGYETGKSYLLQVENEKYLAVVKNSDGKYGLKVVENSSMNGLDELKTMMWTVSVNSQAGSKTAYTFVNNYAQIVLAADVNTAKVNTEKGLDLNVLAGGITEWFSAPSYKEPEGSQPLYANAGNDKVIVLKHDNSQGSSNNVYAVLVKASEFDPAADDQDYLKITPYVATNYVLSANDLNTMLGASGPEAKENSYFTLNFDPAMESIFTDSKLQAVKVENKELEYGSTTEYIDKEYASLKEVKNAYRNTEGGYVALKNLKGEYIVADTAYIAGTDNNSNGLIKFTTDGLYNSKDDTRLRQPGSYLFKFLYNPSDGTVDIRVQSYIRKSKDFLKEAALLATGAKITNDETTFYTSYDKKFVQLGSYWANVEAYDPSDSEKGGLVADPQGEEATNVFITRALLGETNYATLGEQTPASVGTESNIIDITLGAKNIYKPVVMAQGAYLLQVAGSINKQDIGKYWVNNLVGGWELAEQAIRQNYQHMPAAQWVLVNTGSAAAIYNREFEGKAGSGILYGVEGHADQAFFMGGDTLKFIPVAAAMDKYLGYKFVEDKNLDEQLFTFNYLHDLAMDKPINTINNKDSVVWVDKNGEDMKFVLEKVIDDEYGFNGDLRNVSALNRRVYYVRVKDATKLKNNGRYLAYDYQLKKYVVSNNSKTPFFLKENNEVEGGDCYYTLLKANYVYVGNIATKKVVKDEKGGEYIPGLDVEPATVGEGENARTLFTAGTVTDAALQVVDNDIVGSFAAEEGVVFNASGIAEKGIVPSFYYVTKDRVDFINYIPLTTENEVKAYKWEVITTGDATLANHKVKKENNFSVGNTDETVDIFVTKDYDGKDVVLVYKRLVHSNSEYATDKVSVDNNTLALVNGELSDGYWSEVANSAFAVKPSDDLLYRYFATTDTVKIYRVNASEKEFLYEDATSKYSKDKDFNFLGVEDKGLTKNAALFLDTAYVNRETQMPQYMLAVRPTIQEADTILCDAENHKHPTLEDALACPHTSIKPACVKAYYLVNLVDSVAAENDRLEGALINKYLLDNTKYTRLGFVEATHIGDSLIIANSIYTGNATQINPADSTTWASKDTINLSGNTHNPAVFSFRKVSADNDDFLIESESWGDLNGNNVKGETIAEQFAGKIAPSVGGWVKIQNGVPVIANGDYHESATEAEIFNIETTTEAPTANEGISASEVSIVAGNGVVIVKNAAGKNVAISNILGKSIANVVLSSDNETISVPAGIVVVSVEGEEAVKAVVK